MRPRASVLLALVLPGCGGPPPARAPSDNQSIEACGAETHPPLVSYQDARPDARFHLDVHWEGGEWRPVAAVSMPLHHSSRLEWTNLDAWRALSSPSARQGTLRFRFRIVSRQVEPVPGQQRWWATYRAAIESVCRSG